MRGEQTLTDLGVDVPLLRNQRRVFIRPCLDWTERRPHLAGALGAAIADRFFELDWIRRQPGSRAVRPTADGKAHLLCDFAVAL